MQNNLRNERRYICPFSPSRLQELHWTQRQTLKEIGQAAQAIERWEQTPSAATVLGWMRDAGVASRTHSQANRLSAQALRARGMGIFSPESKDKARQATRLHRRPIFVNGHLVYPNVHRRVYTAAMRAQISAQMLSKRRPDYWVTRACGGCAQPVTRPHWKMRRAVVYCSRSCAVRHVTRQKELEGKGRKVTRPCAWCGTPITRVASSMKSERVYCGASCINKYRWKHTVMQTAEQKEKLAAIGRRRGEQQRAQRPTRFCAQCGTPIQRATAHFAADTSYCSRACFAKSQSTVRSQAQFTRALQKREADRAARNSSALEDPENALLDVGQVAALLNRKENTVSSWAKRGKLPQVQSQPIRLFRLSDVQEFLSTLNATGTSAALTDPVREANTTRES